MNAPDIKELMALEDDVRDLLKNMLRGPASELTAINVIENVNRILSRYGYENQSTMVNSTSEAIILSFNDLDPIVFNVTMWEL